MCKEWWKCQVYYAMKRNRVTSKQSIRFHIITRRDTFYFDDEMKCVPGECWNVLMEEMLNATPNAAENQIDVKTRRKENLRIERKLLAEKRRKSFLDESSWGFRQAERLKGRSLSLFAVTSYLNLFERHNFVFLLNLSSNIWSSSRLRLQIYFLVLVEWNSEE